MIGDIKGLKEFSATEDEIKKVREFDRKAQGVTEDDERKAKDCIKNKIEISPLTVLIYCELDRTTAIVDGLFNDYKNIIVINPNREFNFFGSGEIIAELKDYYLKRISQNPKYHFWYGGNLPEDGFFGSNWIPTKDLLQEITNEK